VGVATYQPRAAEGTVLHRVVREHLETFLREVADRSDGGALPRFVELAARAGGVRAAARELGISSSSYARLVRLHEGGTHRRGGGAPGIGESNEACAVAASGVTETAAPSAL
jgi:hypothetical protein